MTKLDATDGWVWEQTDRWLTGLQARGRVRSPNTLRAYRSDMSRWVQTFADIGAATPDEWTETVVEQALVAFNAEGLSGATRRRLLSTLAGFCRWAHKRGVLPVDPCEDDLAVGFGPPTRRPPTVFTDQQLTKIHTAVCIPPAASWSRNAPLDRALFAVLSGCGLRSAEVCGLLRGDVTGTVDDTKLKVTGKGGHTRIVPAGKPTATVLGSWLYQSHADTDGTLREDTEPLFATPPDGRNLTPSALHSRVLSWLKQAGVPKPNGAVVHAFRHTYAHRMALAGVPVPVIQAALGHTNISTTGIYTAATIIDLTEAVAETQPGRVLTPR